MFEIGFVVGAGREQGDARVLAFGRHGLDAVHERAVARGQALHLHAGKRLGELARDLRLDAFVQAKALGYTGISSKACKGVWRSLINLARCKAWNAEAGAARYFMSAEDLTTLAGVCVQQDLALVSAMGLTHVERNGHHFVDGFAGRPKAEAVRFMEAYPDLYADTSRGPRLAIRDGMLDLASVNAAKGLGAAIEPDMGAMDAMPKAAWPPG